MPPARTPTPCYASASESAVRPLESLSEDHRLPVGGPPIDRALGVIVQRSGRKQIVCLEKNAGGEMGRGRRERWAGRRVGEGKAGFGRQVAWPTSAVKEVRRGGWSRGQRPMCVSIGSSLDVAGFVLGLSMQAPQLPSYQAPFDVSPSPHPHDRVVM